MKEKHKMFLQKYSTKVLFLKKIIIIIALILINLWTYTSFDLDIFDWIKVEDRLLNVLTHQIFKYLKNID